MYEAFVYCWTDNLTNILYVGSHKGTEDDGYVCSSKYMMKEYKSRPDKHNDETRKNYLTQEKCMILQNIGKEYLIKLS